MMKLSPTMRVAIQLAQAGGLYYRRGGYWTAADAEPRSGAFMWGEPDVDYVGWGTVRALIDRGVMEITARSVDGVYPHKADLTEIGVALAQER